MCDPWKRQVIWQNLIEKETMHYAHLEELKTNTPPPRVETPLTPKNDAEDPIAAFNTRLPTLALTASSTGTLHHLRRPAAVPVPAPASGAEYRHGLAPRFARKRNASGGLYSM